MKRWIYVVLPVTISGVLAAWWYHPTTKAKRYYSRRAQALNSLPHKVHSPKWQEEFRMKTRRAKEVFEATKAVETYHMGKAVGGEFFNSIGKIDGVPYALKGKDQDANFARRLSQLAFSPVSYTGMHKACTFVPNVAFHAKHKGATATIAICLGCNELALFENDPKLPVGAVGYISGRVRFVEYFDWYRPEFLALAQTAFPGDEELRALPIYSKMFEP